MIARYLIFRKGVNDALGLVEFDNGQIKVIVSDCRTLAPVMDQINRGVDHPLYSELMFLNVPVRYRSLKLVTPVGTRYISSKEGSAKWPAEDKVGIKKAILVIGLKEALKLSKSKQKAVTVKSSDISKATMAEIFGIKTLKSRTNWKTFATLVFKRDSVDVPPVTLRRMFEVWCKKNDKVVPTSKFRGQTIA